MRKLAAVFLGIVFCWCAAFFGSVDVEFGDARYAVGNTTMRNWHLVPMVGKSACAVPLIGGGYPCAAVAAGATTYTLTGPATINPIAVASSNFTVQPVGTLSGSVAVTPADASHRGIFTPSVENLAGSGAQTFTYFPLQTGSFNVSVTNNGGLSNPSPVAVTIPNIALGYPGLTSGWTNGSDTFLLTGVAGDPFGGSNAASIREDNANSTHTAATTAITVVSGHSYTIGVMAKQSVGTRNLDIEFNESGFSAALYETFNISTCAAGTNLSFGGSTISATNTYNGAGIVSGWCWISITGTLGSFTSAQVQLLMNDGTGTAGESYPGDGVSTILLYGPVVQ